MALKLLLSYPGNVLARGEHRGYPWVVMHNGSGYRCGYVRVPPGHPWHGKPYDNIPVDVHWGLTFGEPDSPRGQKVDGGGWWFGFDCGHAFDEPDPTLPIPPELRAIQVSLPSSKLFGEAIRTQEYVELECRSVCEQAAAAQAKVLDPGSER